MPKYQPTPDLPEDVRKDARRIQEALLRPEVELATYTRLYAVPAKLADGMVCYFDAAAGVGAAGGTTGMYRYDGAAWNLLG